MTESKRSSAVPDWIQKHTARYIATDGTDGYLWDASLGGGEGLVPTLLLTTVGRKSGNHLTLPLIFNSWGADFIVVASKGGAKSHPAWYFNLQANPEVLVQIKGDKFKARARTANAHERAELWPQMVKLYGPYAQYQTKTDREIPIVVLTRS